jgi:hypothetical protein
MRNRVHCGMVATVCMAELRYMHDRGSLAGAPRHDRSGVENAVTSMGYMIR